MKNCLFIISILIVLTSCNNKKLNLNNTSENTAIQKNQNNYALAMEAYGLGNYKISSELFLKIIENNKLDDITSNKLYNGACIFSLAEENEMAIKLLDYLTTNRFYSSYDHLLSDTDLNNLHSEPLWNQVVEKTAENKKTKPERFRKKIKTELFKVKDILKAENGKLWNKNIWSDDILILDFDNTIYSLLPLENSKTKDSILYYKKIPDNTLGFSNSAQKFNGKDYAVILSNYLDDNSSTIIHELFHVLQNKYILLNGNPIEYLDNYDAREWLRLEYQALKNTLNAMNKKANKSVIEKYLKDAMLFRKLRQSKYKKYLKEEIEIETSEGLANYTGFKLSTYPNLYLEAIKEINQREQAQTYTRPFPYATGLAYGLIFDYLKIDWKKGLDTTYNFLSIYETNYLNKELKPNENKLSLAQGRNNYKEIHQQELDRKIKNEKIIAYYTDMFIKRPTLKVTLADESYGRSFDMNGTLILKDRGIVYSSIKGIDNSANNFGNFSTINGKAKLGVSGILYSFDGTVFIFPEPIKIESGKIVGEHYEIQLNEGWEVIKLNTKGDLELVKKK